MEFVDHPTNRGWTRDSGPIFVGGRPEASAETAIVHFHFNAWAKYANWQQDRRVPEPRPRLLGAAAVRRRVGRRKFVLEGGGIDVNGRGTLLTTEECYLDPTCRCATRA